MLFNSYSYLFLFLPLALIGYFSISKNSEFKLFWLTGASFLFYAWWNPVYLPIIIISILTNFWLGCFIVASEKKKNWLYLGIIFNVSLLGFFKYTNFLMQVLGVNVSYSKIDLPLGISFFTFTQIAYLVDSAKEKINEKSLLHYALFVTFFPHLLAGPILHHKEMMPQFSDVNNRRFISENFSRGLFLLVIGFGKKMLIADPLGDAANLGYNTVGALDFGSAWSTTLAYTLQLYFDFSGYTDMALGTALMFNIRLPVNFNSPYLAINIQEFWRRWHITLSRFLRDYLYIPLGGNRGKFYQIAISVLVTFILGGLWHGAGWSFIVWGALHGIAVVICRLWKFTKIKIPKIFSWCITLLFVHITWVFFRAASISEALLILKKLIPNSFSEFSNVFIRMPNTFIFNVPYGSPSINIYIAIATAIVLLPNNSNKLAMNFRGTLLESMFTAITLVLSILSLGQVSQFLYFNF